MIKLVPDKKSYKAARLRTCWRCCRPTKAHLLVTTELSSVITVRQIDAPGRSVVIDVPIDRKYEPNVYLDVSFVKDSDMYNQSQLIAVPARDKMLKLDIVPTRRNSSRATSRHTRSLRGTKTVRPRPTPEVSLGIIDEAIYSIQPETAANINASLRQAL